jgi:hypothetical protein
VFEDLECHKDLVEMEVKFPTLKLFGEKSYAEAQPYSIAVSQVTAAKLKTLPIDEITVVINASMDQRRGRSSSIVATGKIKQILANEVVISTKFRVDSRTTVSRLSFEYNRTSTRAIMTALNFVREQKTIASLLSNFQDVSLAPSRFASFTEVPVGDFHWSDSQFAENTEQQAAIRNIVNCTAFPFPYVVFGPPGEHQNLCMVK